MTPVSCPPLPLGVSPLPPLGPHSAYTLATRFPSHRLAVVGHSAGGQMLGLADAVSRLRAVLLIGSPHGWWRNWRGREALWLALTWYVVTPISVAMLGYFPGKLVGMGNLPPGIAKQWAR